MNSMRDAIRGVNVRKPTFHWRPTRDVEYVKSCVDISRVHVNHEALSPDDFASTTPLSAYHTANTPVTGH